MTLASDGQRASRGWRVADAFFLIAVSIYILAGVPITPFHGDESTQIYMSRDYAYLFQQGDLGKVLYSDPPVSAAEQELRLLNGTIPKYLFGLAWDVSGFQVADVNEQWDWGASWDYNQQYGHAPSPELLVTSRWPSALLTVLGAVFVFALAYPFGGRVMAYAAVLLIALSPPVLVNGRRAMMEGALFAFSMMTLWAGVFWVRAYEQSQSSRTRWLWTLLLGVAGGLAVASKHPTVVTLGAVFVGCALASMVQAVQARFSPSAQRMLWLQAGQLLIAGVLACGVFYLLNPAWWGDPFGRPNDVLTLRRNLLGGQVMYSPLGYEDGRDAAFGFLRATFYTPTQHFEEVGAGWETWVGDQIRQYETSGLSGIESSRTFIGAGVVLTFTLFGFAVFIISRSVRAPLKVLLIAWAAITVAATIALTPLEWQRYYLPVYPVVGLFAAYGLSHIFFVARNRLFPS